MENKNFSLYKTLYLTRRDNYELPNHRKHSFKKLYYHDAFVDGEIELGKRYRVEVFEIIEPWTLKIDDYLNFFESKKENIIGAQVSNVEWSELNDHLDDLVEYGTNYELENQNLWVDCDKKCWVPQIDLFPIPFYFYLGCIVPDWDADQNCIFLFYPFEEGTEDLYDPNVVSKEKSSFHHDGIQDESFGRGRNNGDFFSGNYLGTPRMF